MCAISVATENASVRWSDEQLNHAVRGIHSESLTVGTIESLAAYVFCASVLQIVLTLTDACCLGSCEDCRRHNVKADVVLFAKYAANNVQTLECCSMCKHTTSVNVADGIYALYVGLEVVVHNDAGTTTLDACCLKVKTLNNGTTTSGNEHDVCAYLRSLALLLEGDNELT